LSTWDYGWQEQGHRRKYMSRQSVNTPPLISKFNHTMILSTATQNIHGMIIYNHKALKINLRRAGEVCPEKAKICLLCLGKSQIDTTQAAIDGILNNTSLYHQTSTQHLVGKNN
jgi:hypothetical protein